MAFFDRMRDFFGAFDRDGALARALNLARDRDLNLDLSSALEVARTLASVLGSDRASVLDQARDLAGDLVRDLTNARDSDYRGHRHHALNRATETACDLVEALDVALGSVLEGDYVPDRTDNPDLDLSRNLASALAKCHDLLRALASYPDIDGDRDLASDFAYYRDVAQDLARYLDHHCARPSGPDTEGFRSLPGRVALAVWLLPRPWQARYREEYHAELAQLGRAERNEYARGVLAEAWPLRKELKGTPCPPDSARAGE